MVDSTLFSRERSSSPEVQAKASRRERRRSVSRSPAIAAQAHELDRLARAKKRQSQSDRIPSLNDTSSFWEESTTTGPAQVDPVEAPVGNTNLDNQHGQKLLPRRPRLHGHAEGQDDGSLWKDLNIVLHDISQSMWIENPTNHSTEKVYLTVEAAALDEMLTIDPSFSWMYVLFRCSGKPC